jgi:hypothetical protein
MEDATIIAHKTTQTIPAPPPPPALDHRHDEENMTTTTALMRRLLPHPHDASHLPRRLRQQLRVLDTVLRGLYDRYLQRVPQVETIVNHIVQRSWQRYGPNTTIENDHIAFRSLSFLHPSQDDHPHPQHGIAYLERFFIDYCGYEKRDYYHFAEKKLNAYWYAPPNAFYPRIFISELRVDELVSDRAQSILHEAMKPSTATQLWELPDLHDDNDNNDSEDEAEKCQALGQAIVTALQAPIFEPRSLSYAKYEFLKAESEYAAWVYGTNSHDMNHLTLAVHHLPEPIDELHHFNDMVAHELQISLNAAQSPIQTSPDGLLLQSSTVAAPLAVEFYDDDNDEDGQRRTTTTTTRYIPGSYVEFAERRILPQFVNEQSLKSSTTIGREHRREGFEASNANVIFESTFDRNKNNDNSDNNNVHNTTTTN